MRTLIAVATAVLVAGCASVSERGWQGTGAEPFDRASAACNTEVANVAPERKNEAFEACMARHGWHRP